MGGDKMFSKNAKSTETRGSLRPVPRQTVPSLISQDMRITGDVECDGDMQIDGTINGDVKSRMLTVGETGQVRGAIISDAAHVCGAVTGQIRARKVELAKTAKVIGDIVHESLAIEAGAFVEGNFKRSDGKAKALIEGPHKISVLQDTVPNPLVRKVRRATNL